MLVKLVGYVNVIESCTGESPEPALRTLAEHVIKNGIDYNLIPQGGVNLQGYVSPEGIIWVVVQTMVFLEQTDNSYNYFNAKEMR